jgi:aminopeptidase-like protein
MLDLVRDLYPICRSITGPGIRATLTRVAREIPLVLTDTPTGTPVFDWVVPREWMLRRATLSTTTGDVLVDSDRHNLHVLNYSIPYQGRVERGVLDKHLHSMPDKPDWIPYRTSYYTPTWGICLPHSRRASLGEPSYDVNIDVDLFDGALTYGECLVPGRERREVLFSVHACHPSLANDNLSGIAIATELFRWLQTRNNRWSYRLVMLPGTIGSITWLANNADRTRDIIGGLVLSCLGDGGAMHYKRSRRVTSVTDQTIERVIAELEPGGVVRDFVPYGYDERQYCSPGFDLPIGCLMRTPNGEYSEYHTSADDVDLLSEPAMLQSLAVLKRFVERMEAEQDVESRGSASEQGDGRRWLSRNPHCEPMLGRRGLYAAMGGKANVPQLQMALLWMMNYADGRHGIDWVSHRSGIAQETLEQAADLLTKADLLQAV